MSNYIGIDIGGTNIRVGLIDENNDLICTYKEPTLKEVTNVEELYEKIKKLIKRVPNYENVNAIGIGVPGYIDVETGKIEAATNLKMIVDFPLSERLKNDFEKSVYIDNDARVATLGEAIMGAGKSKKIVCYVTISTGLGGGVVIEDNIYHGSGNLGGYFGSLILDGESTSEVLISGTALIKQAKEKINSNVQNVQEIFVLAKAKNAIAKEIVETFKRNLAVLLLNISYTINPNIIVLGGGVLKSKEYFLEDVIKEFKLKAKDTAKDTIIETTLLEEPGVVGAALLAKCKEENSIKTRVEN